MLSSRHVKADLREPRAFYRLPTRYQLKEADTFTQNSLSHKQLGPVDTATNSEQCESSRQVAQGWLQTMSAIDLYLNPVKVGPEPIQSVVGLRPHQSSAKLAM